MYKKFYYIGTFDNWFDIWCIMLGAFILVGGLLYFKSFLNYNVYLWQRSGQATEEKKLRKF